MNKLQKFSIVMILCMLLIASDFIGTVEGDKEIKKPTFTERLTSLLYVSSPTSSSSSTSTSNWDKFKALVSQVHAYFSPPNLDFRGSEEHGGGEKVKEAAARSLEKSKEAVEDSAKSAAKMAGQTVQKVKKSLSNREEAQDPQQSSEL